MGSPWSFLFSLLPSLAFFMAGVALPMLGVQSIASAVVLLVLAFILLAVAVWFGLRLPVPRFPQKRQLVLPDGSLPAPPSRTKVLLVVTALSTVYALAVASQWIPQLEPILALIMVLALAVLFVGYPILGVVYGVRRLWFRVRRRSPRTPYH